VVRFIAVGGAIAAPFLVNGGLIAVADGNGRGWFSLGLGLLGGLQSVRLLRGPGRTGGFEPGELTDTRRRRLLYAVVALTGGGDRRHRVGRSGGPRCGVAGAHLRRGGARLDRGRRGHPARREGGESWEVKPGLSASGVDQLGPPRRRRGRGVAVRRPPGRRRAES
jgi:hypothetical protein